MFVVRLAPPRTSGFATKKFAGSPAAAAKLRNLVLPACPALTPFKYARKIGSGDVPGAPVYANVATPLAAIFARRFAWAFLNSSTKPFVMMFGSFRLIVSQSSRCRLPTYRISNAVSRPSLRCQPTEYDCVYGSCRFESKRLTVFVTEFGRIGYETDGAAGSVGCVRKRIGSVVFVLSRCSVT